jgi:iron complex transport system substrate-binding protein
VVTLGGDTLDGVLADVERVAAALGIPEAGAALVGAARARIARVQARVAGRPRPRCAVVEWSAPVFLAGHWGPEMVALAGGDDVLGVAGAHSVTVPLAALAAADPEVVIVAPCGYGVEAAAAEARALLERPEWGWLAAGGRAVWALDANAYLSRPGPRLVDGIELLAAIFHPGCAGAAGAAGAGAARIR